VHPPPDPARLGQYIDPVGRRGGGGGDAYLKLQAAIKLAARNGLDRKSMEM